MSQKLTMTTTPQEGKSENKLALKTPSEAPSRWPLQNPKMSVPHPGRVKAARQVLSLPALSKMYTSLTSTVWTGLHRVGPPRNCRNGPPHMWTRDSIPDQVASLPSRSPRQKPWTTFQLCEIKLHSSSSVHLAPCFRKSKPPGANRP
jgi:hypothetical protein